MKPKLRYAARSSDWTPESCYNCGESIRRTTIIRLNHCAIVDSDYSDDHFIPRSSSLESDIYTEVCHCVLTTHPGKKPEERLRQEPPERGFAAKPTLALITTRATSKSCKDCKSVTEAITVSCLGRRAENDYQGKQGRYYPDRTDAISKTYILLCTCRFTFNPFTRSDPPSVTESESD